MAYAIIKWGRIQTVVQAASATAHNYRQYEVSNADQEAPHPNIEFVNVAERDYWEVASERITEAGITPRRKDAVRCVEAFITASPEFFKCDPNGWTADYSQSNWLKDTRIFLTEKFGEKNLIAFQLHQDEKTPHIHAVIVPITPNGQLSARGLFNPATMRGYQREYAEKMKDHL
ncbi:plasmid recombination protein [Hymenobacter sp. DH14]|uniref:Plasmid recombination protein n=1 Tax=Hymenobacter cyanobacteriorum TaxID=2926463 RepID=A0A9X2AKH4_9BACT|nr:MobV family relaxase [Hymenobacter cyanobacteriorum]MCI1189864.1 plasmid recombination protein [Hymenobacter cyanobacteriorum]